MCLEKMHLTLLSEELAGAVVVVVGDGVVVTTILTPTPPYFCVPWVGVYLSKGPDSIRQEHCV